MGAKKKNKQKRFEEKKKRAKMYKNLATDPRGRGRAYKKHG